jgi:hypothetical protein
MLRWEGMGSNHRQILRLARILIEKYGRGAPAVAAHRVRLWTEADDPATAELWRVVGEAIARQFTRPRHEPSVPEVLDGAVTRLMMDADRVSREDVEAVMSTAQKRRRRSARRSRSTLRRSSRS